MNFVFSPEEEGLKIYLDDISWKDLANVLSNEIVDVEVFTVHISNPFTFSERADLDISAVLEIKQQKLTVGKISEQIILDNPLSIFNTVDADRLKSGFPELVEKGLGFDEVWQKYLTECLSYEEPHEVSLRNMNFSLQSENYRSYMLTFGRVENLIHFAEALDKSISSSDSQRLKDAVTLGKTEVSDKWSLNLHDAENSGRISRLVSLRQKSLNRDFREYMSMPGAQNTEPAAFEQKTILGKHGDIELAVIRFNYGIELYVEGLSWKVLTDSLKDEAVNILELKLVTEKNLVLPVNDFAYEEGILTFNNRVIVLRDLALSLNKLELGENLDELMFAEAINKDFYMNYRSAECYRFIFWNEEKLYRFVEALIAHNNCESQMAEVKNSISNGQPYVSNELKGDFERAASVERMERILENLSSFGTAPIEATFKNAIEKIGSLSVAVTGHEPEAPTNYSEKEKATPIIRDSYFFAYQVLMRDELNRFDGVGKILGYNGEVILNSIIAIFKRRKLNDYAESMKRLLANYRGRFQYQKNGEPPSIL